MSNVSPQTNSPNFKLCRKCGFSETAIAHRLKQMELGEADLPLVDILMQHVILPAHKRVMDDFYEYMFTEAEMRPFIGAESNLKRLKQFQTEYLLSFGRDFQSAEYFEYRLRIGFAHARISMPMHLYIAAYNKMQNLLLQALSNSDITEPENRTLCHMLIVKIIFLDISLAIDAYNYSTLTNLSESVHQLEKEKNRLSNQLMYDTLTGALSRAYILDLLTKYVSLQQRRKQQQLSVALFDIDHFKKVNDSYGHQVGDAILVKFSETIQSVIRGHDYLGRYGGEEFLFVIVNTDPETAHQLVERIRTSIEDAVYNINGIEIRITTSVGLCHITTGDDTDSMIERADKALYKAKSAGRNQTIELK